MARIFDNIDQDLLTALRATYSPAPNSPIPNAVPKVGDEIEHSILQKLQAAGKPIAAYKSRGSSNTVNYSRKVGYFLQVIDFIPLVLGGDGTRRPPSEFKTIYLNSAEAARAVLASLNSSLFYWFITLLSDCRHLNKREVEAFPLAIALLHPARIDAVSTAVSLLMEDLQKQSERRVMKFKHDQLTVQCLLPKKSWLAIEGLDDLISRSYGLSAEEMDYIRSYDIKYRMGLNGGNADND